MATTQRPRQQRPSAPSPEEGPNLIGIVLILVGVVIGIILLVKAGGVGVDSTDAGVEVPAGKEKVTTTTQAPTTTVAEQAPATVQVVAANGSGASGMAAKAGQVLAQGGYTQVVATNSNQPVTASSVMFASGYEANAKSIAKLFGLAETTVTPLAAGSSVAQNQPPTTGVVVMIGPDLVPKLNGAAAGTATTVAGGTATTVKPGTATTVKQGTATTVAGGTATTARSGSVTTTTAP